MADKMTCPGCDAYTSGVLAAYANGEPCPYCGLSASAMGEISDVRRKKADDALKQRVEALIKERDELRRQVGRLHRFAYAVSVALDPLSRDDGNMTKTRPVGREAS